MPKNGKWNTNRLRRLFERRYDALSDENLMFLIRRRNEKAFETLYHRYHRSVLHYFCRMLNGETDMAQDFLQELFMKIVEHPERFDTHFRFSTWIYTLAHNMCKNEYRRRQVREKLYATVSASVELTVPPQEESGMDYETFGHALNRALSGLSVEHRSTFVLRFQKKMSIREIHNILGCSEGTVKSRLYYATRKLAEMLDCFNPTQER